MLEESATNLSKGKPAMGGIRVIYIVGGLVIVVAAFFITSYALDYWSESSRTAQAGDEVKQIVGSFRSMFSNKLVDLGVWPTDITGLAINNRLLPSDMLPTNVKCTGSTSSDTCYGVGPWSGSVVKIYSGQGQNAIGAVYSNLNKTACFALAIAQVKPDRGLAIVNIGGTGYAFPPIGNSSYPTTSDVEQACNKATDNNVQLLYSMKPTS